VIDKNRSDLEKAKKQITLLEDKLDQKEHQLIQMRYDVEEKNRRLTTL
jgi:hypothetical protein